jgi:ATP-dependent protease HslVU (ClpYQ) peptidase subunit
MTCIIAWKDPNNKKVILAGDKMGSNSTNSDIVIDPKIFKKEDFLIGYAGSFRAGQIIKHLWKPPKRKVDQSDSDYIYTSVVNTFKKTLEKNGIEDEGDVGSYIIIYNNRIFLYQNDHSILEHFNLVESIGAGEDFAKGAVNVLIKYEKDVKIIAKEAFKSISKHIVSVSNEHDILIYGE